VLSSRLTIEPKGIDCEVLNPCDSVVSALAGVGTSEIASSKKTVAAPHITDADKRPLCMCLCRLFVVILPAVPLMVQYSKNTEVTLMLISDTIKAEKVSRNASNATPTNRIYGFRAGDCAGVGGNFADTCTVISVGSSAARRPGGAENRR
jgi:hypothetical protein